VLRRAASALSRRRVRLARALSCLLLFLIAYSATLGVVHRHGTPGPLNVTSATGTSAVGAQTDSRSTKSPLRVDDCSICQLHRQLNGGLLYAPALLPAQAAQQASDPVVLLPYLPATEAPRRGRAPPSTSLA
jgi:hypothetical protein